MSKSPNIGLNITASSDNTKSFIDFRTEIAGDEEDSNMMILDSEIHSIKDDVKGITDDISEIQSEFSNIKNNYGGAVTWGTLKGISAKENIE